MKWKWYVYILECSDDSYYVEMTWRPDQRWNQHLSGLGSAYTSKHGVKQLAYLEEYDDLGKARLREKQLKGWIRIKKQKLISGEWSKW